MGLMNICATRVEGQLTDFPQESHQTRQKHFQAVARQIVQELQCTSWMAKKDLRIYSEAHKRLTGTLVLNELLPHNEHWQKILC